MDYINAVSSEVFLRLNALYDMCGAIGITSCWNYQNKLGVQCNKEKLEKFIADNGLDCTVTEYEYEGQNKEQINVELENVILYAV